MLACARELESEFAVGLVGCHPFRLPLAKGWRPEPAAPSRKIAESLIEEPIGTDMSACGKWFSTSDSKPALLLGLAALVAAVIPSQRAASVDPVVALRND
jgi:hypothetical protein